MDTQVVQPTTQTQAIQRVAPWTKKGTVVVGAMTTAEAIIKAGLNFNVEKQPVYTGYTKKDDFGAEQTIPVQIKNKRAIMRMDTFQVIGMTGEDYHVVQNVESFGFFDNLISEKGIQIEAVGIKGCGEKMWILAKMLDTMDINGDQVGTYVLLVNSHDGSCAISVNLVPFRFACWNALNRALKSSTLVVSVRHTQSCEEKLKQAHIVYDRLMKQKRITENYFQAMANKLVNPVEVQAYMDALFPIRDPQARGATRTANIRKEVIRLFNEGKGNKGQSLWDLYNGVTEYSDHFRVVRGNGDRFEIGVLGSGVLLKTRAFQTAVSMLPEARDFEKTVLAA